VVDAANIVTGLSVFLLLAAIASWAKLVYGQDLWELDGQLAVSPQAELASQLLVLSFILSAVAATLALVNHFAP